jgi:biotin transport system substrate-specific component
MSFFKQLNNGSKDMSRHTRNLVLAALMAALMAVTAWISFPTIGGIPLSPQTLFVVLAACLLKARWAGASMALYVLLGTCGLPVFAQGRGGIAVLAGPTGGYLVGFIIAAVLGALIFHLGTGSEEPLSSGARWVIDATGIVATSLLVNACGAAWMMVSMGLTLNKALAVGFVPFVFPNLVKGFVAVLIARYLARVVWADKS